MSIPNDLSNLEKMQNMKNMFGEGFIEFLKQSIKIHQNENVIKMLDIAKDKPETYIELLSVAILHHNIPVFKHIIEKFNLTENDSPYINALSFYNSIFADDSPNKLTETKDGFIDVQIPYVLLAGISGHIDIFEYMMNHKLIVNKNLTGIIGISKKHKNIFNSNVIGACSFYGKSRLLDFILKNYKEELDIEFSTTEKKAKNNKMRFSKEYSGCTPALLALVGPADDKDTLDVLKTLAEYGSKFDISNWNQDNILHLATKNKKLECAKYICGELGLKNLLSQNNKEGYNPLSLAQHLNEDKFISYFHDINEEDEKKIEENLKELLAESVNKETKKGKKKKGKKKGKNNDTNDDIPGFFASSDYQETLKEIVPKKVEEENDNKIESSELINASNNKKRNNNINNKKKETEEENDDEEEIKEESTPEPEDNIIIGLSFKNNKKNKKLKIGDKNKHEVKTKNETSIPIKEQENEINNINSNPNNDIIKQEPVEEKTQETKTEIEIKKEKEKKAKIKKIKKEKRKNKENTDEFLEQMRKREKERRLEEEKKKKEQEEKEQKEREEQQRILEEEKQRKEQEEQQRLEELKKLELEKLKQEEEEKHKKEEEEEKSDKDFLSYSEEENNNINNINNNNISEEKEEEKEVKISMEDYEILNKNYQELEKRLSTLEKEKTQLTSCLTKLYLENKSNSQIVSNPNEENINDLMYLANKELAYKDEIISDYENKLTMLDLTNIKNFSVEKLKKFKDFYEKNLQIIKNAMK